MSDEKQTYKLGATAPALEMIRDFLRDDIRDLKRDLDALTDKISRMSTALEHLHNHIDTMETVTFELLESTIAVNANTMIQNVEN